GGGVLGDRGGAPPGPGRAPRRAAPPRTRTRGGGGGTLGSPARAGAPPPPLLACDTVVEAASVRGTRDIPIGEFFTGVKRSALAPDELIAAVRVPAADGPQQFSKVGVRNAMVIAVCSFAVAL